MANKTDKTKGNRIHRLTNIRVNDEELATINQRLKETGLSTSEYQRRMCLDGQVVVRESSVNVEAVRQLLAIGRNLNQLVKSGHIRKQVDSQELQTTLKDVQRVVSELMP